MAKYVSLRLKFLDQPRVMTMEEYEKRRPDLTDGVVIEATELARRPRPTTNQEALERWPRLAGHLICTSLGYACPLTAGSILLAVSQKRQHYCEWINACYRGNPRPPVSEAFHHRRFHSGYMASYGHAQALVQETLQHGQPAGMLASWF